MLQSCYQHLGKNDEWAEFLRRAVEENTGAAAELMLADILEAREGTDTAQVYITRQLQRHPTMRVPQVSGLPSNEAEEGRAKESLMVLRDMVGEQVRAASLGIVATSADLPHIHCTGTAILSLMVND